MELLLDKETRRKTLSDIRQLIKDKDEFEKIYSLCDKEYDLFISMLSDEDGKTRKNVALLLGDLGFEDALMNLWEAYEKEEQLFVKSAYLEAMLNLDYSDLVVKLHEKVEMLSSMEVLPEHRKHVDEQLRILNQLLVQEEGINLHIFKGYNYEHECVLFTNKDYKEYTEKQIAKGEIMPFSAGVKVKTKNLEDILDIRSYSEILFTIPGLAPLSGTPDEMGKAIAKSGLIEMLNRDHKTGAPYYFRIELKTKLDLEKKTALSKKLASSIELNTNRKLINSPKDYEFELRLIEGKSGNFHGLIKYMTIPDVRFEYRQEYMSNSIKPWQAALLVQLAKDYMVADAQVLDPFCGVATMLIERQKVVKGNTSYGIDISGEAVEKAKKNMAAADQIIHFVNKDFFEFTHEYLFDEIFTNMPWAIGRTTQKEVEDIYRKFFIKAKEVMKDNSTIIMYNHDADLAKRHALKNDYKLVKEFVISQKEGATLSIFRR